MNTCNLTITRKKQFVASLASYIVEIDGVAYGKIKNGSSLSCMLEEGNHEVSFKWFGFTYKSPDIYIPQGLDCLNVGLKFNVWTSKLDLIIDKKDYEYIQDQKSIKEKECLDNLASIIDDKKMVKNLDIDNLDGAEFEEWCANLLRNNCFTNVQVTKTSGDQGVDILAQKNDIKYAIQCKCYSSNLGNSPIQEVHAGKSMYNCHVGVVMTNRHFTSGAKKLANATGVLLWDREKLLQMQSNTEETMSNLSSNDDIDNIETDEKLLEAIRLAVEEGRISTSLMQRRLGIGYGQAAHLIDKMEELGVVGKPGGTKPRKVLISVADYMEMFVLNNVN